MTPEVFDWAVKLLLVAFFAWVAWTLNRLRFTFEIQVRDGVARATRGKVASSALHVIAEACSEKGVMHGRIRGQRRGAMTSLSFSKEFPPGLCQRIRNEWTHVG